MLGFIALIGLMAHAAGVKVDNPARRRAAALLESVPIGLSASAFAAIAIGALVPAAVMSIGAANTFTRNVWKPFVDPRSARARRPRSPNSMSLVVKVGALGRDLVHADEIRARSAIARRRLDDPDLSSRDLRALHSLVFRLGPFDRLGGRHDLGTWLAWAPTAWTPLHKIFETDITVYNGLIALVGECRRRRGARSAAAEHGAGRDERQRLRRCGSG